MGIFDHPDFDHHELLQYVDVPDSGLRAIVASSLHDSRPGSGRLPPLDLFADGRPRADGCAAPVARHDLQERGRGAALSAAASR